MNKLICLSGVSGSGKSTLANKLCEEERAKNQVCPIFSADHYWLRPDGFYSWNMRELSRAHNWTFNRFDIFVIDGIKKDYYIAILDNTNLQFKEFERYVDLALRNKWEVEIKRLDCPFSAEELFKRNIHNVPLDTIKKQIQRWESQDLLNFQLEQFRSKINVSQS